MGVTKPEEKYTLGLLAISFCAKALINEKELRVSDKMSDFKSCKFKLMLNFLV
jgi:hypothetical protein